jgi:hypothetical protein
MATISTLPSRLSANEALIALLVAAIEINEHASPEEMARAERVVHELAGLRRLSRQARGRIIGDMKEAVRVHGPAAVMAAACEKLPPRLHRKAVVAIAEVMSTHRFDRNESAALLDVARCFGFSADDIAAAVDEARRAVRADG